MFYPLPRAQQAAVLDREFSTLEDAAKKIGVRLICRDLVQILSPAYCQDPQGKFLMKSFKQNGLPYTAYTTDETVSFAKIYSLLPYLANSCRTVAINPRDSAAERTRREKTFQIHKFAVRTDRADRDQPSLVQRIPVISASRTRREIPRGLSLAGSHRRESRSDRGVVARKRLRFEYDIIPAIYQQVGGNPAVVRTQLCFLLCATHAHQLCAAYSMVHQGPQRLHA